MIGFGDSTYWLGRKMTREDAEIVRDLYKDTDLTWRGLAEAFFVRTEGHDRWDGNQLAGMALHEDAQHLLGEVWE